MDDFERVRPRLLWLRWRVHADRDDPRRDRRPPPPAGRALPGRTFRAFAAGHHMPGLPGAGTQTFDAWLASGAVK